MSAGMTEILLEQYGPFMDIDELSDLLKIKRQSMYQSIYHGKFDVPHAKLGKKYLFPTQEVANFLNDMIQVSA